MATRQDTFNRSDRSISGDTWSDSSTTWTLVSGNLAIVTNVVNSSSSGLAIDATAPNSATQRVTIVTNFVYYTIRAICRYTDSNNYYFAQTRLGGNIDIYKRVAGTETLLVSYTGGFSAGQSFGLDCNGTTLTLYIDGSSSGTSTTDSDLTTGGWGFAITEVFNTGVNQFDVTYTADAGGGPVIPVFMHQYRRRYA